MTKHESFLPNNPNPLQAVESFLESQLSSESLSVPQQLFAPNAVGAEVSGLQSLITWANASPSKEVVLRSEAFQPGTTLSPVEIAAIRLSSSVRSTLKKTNERPAAVGNALKSLEQTNYAIEENIPRDNYWWLVADSTSQANPRTLYSSNEILRPAEAYYALITKAFSASTRHFQEFVAPPSDQTRRHLATIIYELFKNTHDWARTSWDESRIRRSIRCIHVRSYTTANLEMRYDDALSAFISRQKKSAFGLFEISILDSGPGLAQRFARSPLHAIEDLDTEYRLVKSCLDLHGTSSGNPMRGVGLHGVMTALNDIRGFLRIRTGRLSLCRPVDIHGYTATHARIPRLSERQFSPWLMDLNSQKFTTNTMPFVQGTLITAILPILLRA